MVNSQLLIRVELRNTVKHEKSVLKRVEDSKVIYAHEKCRKDYIRRPPPVKGCEASNSKERLLRSDSFDFKHCYFFFEDFAKVHIKNSNQNINQVQTIGILDTIRLHSKIRKDDRRRNISLRSDSVKDLVVAERRYHRNCYTNLLWPNFKIPRTCYKTGRSCPPPHCNKNESFVKLCEYIENSEEDCQFSISELINNLGKIDPSSSTCSGKHLKRKLIEFYGDSVVFTHLPGLPSIVCFSGYRTATLTEKWYDAKKINEINKRNRIAMMLQK